MKAVAFDFGNTLAYSGLPLNWQDFYCDALTAVLKATGTEVTSGKLQGAEKILRKYNARINEREYEVTSDTIFTELFNDWGITGSSAMKPAKDAFYSFFFTKTEVYPDTESLLRELKNKRLKLGILSDTAYGAGKEYLLAGVPHSAKYFDVLLTSTDVGFRKPNVTGYLRLARELGVKTADCLFVGDEPKDIIGANNSGMISILINRTNENRDYGQKYTVGTLEEILKLV